MCMQFIMQCEVKIRRSLLANSAKFFARFHILLNECYIKLRVMSLAYLHQNNDCSVAFCLDTWFRGTIDLLETRKTKLNCCVGIFWKTQTQSKVIRYKRGCGARGRKYASFKKQEIKKVCN